MTYQIAIAAGSFVGGRVVDGFGVVPALVVGGIAVVIALGLLLGSLKPACRRTPRYADR